MGRAPGAPATTHMSSSAVRTHFHVCFVCQKVIPCTLMLSKTDEPPPADEPCNECGALQIQEQDAEGRVTAKFFCCDEHMYDYMLESEVLFGGPPLPSPVD